MSLLISNQPTRSEQHLLYAANHPQGRPFNDVYVQINARKANETLGQNLITSAFSGLGKTMALGASLASITPFLITSTRATITGATFEKVCGASDQNYNLISDAVHGFFEYCRSASVSITTFIDSWGISCKELPFTSEDSWLGDKLAKFEDGMNSFVYRADVSLDHFCEAKQVEEGFQLVSPRLINYLGSVISTVKNALDYEYAPHIFVATATFLCAYRMTGRFSLPSQSQQAALDIIQQNIDGMVETLKELEQTVKTKDEKLSLKDLALSILDNKEALHAELTHLNLSRLTYDEQKKMLKPLITLAREINDKY